LTGAHLEAGESDQGVTALRVNLESPAELFFGLRRPAGVS